MVRLHGSFLVRWWVRDDGGERIELIHIQSGAKAVTESLAEALTWMRLSAGSDTAAPDKPPPATEEHRQRGGTPRDQG
jgi:hypothetical protein